MITGKLRCKSCKETALEIEAKVVNHGKQKGIAPKRIECSSCGSTELEIVGNQGEDQSQIVTPN